MLKFLDAMNYDAVCLGNHDFLNGPDQLIQTVNNANAKFPVLAANLDPSTFAGGDTLTKVIPPYKIFGVNGVKVGVIGLTTYDFMYASYIAPVQITNMIDAAQAAANVLRPQVDLLIVLSHNDISVNTQLARAVNGVDVVVSGHAHVKTPEPTMVTNAGKQVPVVEAGEWGKFLGELHMSVDLVSHAVKFSSYRLWPVTKDIAEDPAINSMIVEQDQALQAQLGRDLNEKLADADFSFLYDDQAESSLGNLALRAYQSAVPSADFSLEEISLTGSGLGKGAVSFGDVHDVVPHIYNAATKKEWTLHLWKASGKDLVSLFDVFYSVSGLIPFGSPLGWLSAQNVDVLWEPKPLPSIKLLTIGNRAIDVNADYQVALTDGLLAGVRLASEKFYLGVDTTQVADTGIEAWKSIVDFVSSVKTLKLADYRVGAAAGPRTHTQSVDLAIHYYDFAWDQKSLSMVVENFGRTDATQFTVKCFTGLQNDLVKYGTNDQVWTQFAEQSLNGLASGLNVSVSMALPVSKLPLGYTPIKCEVDSTEDHYPTNNSAVTVLNVLASSARRR
ncbi:MAG: bifunctional metallophosphatase/5'-nucleotidase, partial [Bdellovibrionota bacterium]